jgi:poly-beta-1,6-N-acetyl-D-glucosamine synthase
VILDLLGLFLLAYVGFYPIVWSGLWISGSLVFRLTDEEADPEPPPGGWPGVTVLIPAYNEEAVVATSVTAALAVDYPDIEVLVLDDGSTDRTAEAATAAGKGDRRLEVVRDPENRGKAERLNIGFRRARHELVVVCDADTHLHPLSLQLLVARMGRSPLLAAVAGAPHVTNRQGFLATMQVLEVASIIGLIRRAQAVTGRVGVVAGVLGIFRRDAVLEVGGYRDNMATEDIDLSWRLILAGWHTSYEPAALVGMEVPSTLRALWAQRRRWARGGSEVLRVHGSQAFRWRNRRMWLLALESSGSLMWVVFFAAATVMSGLTAIATPGLSVPVALLMTAWGVAVAVVAMIQLTFALTLDFPHDRFAVLAFLLGPIYPYAYWLIGSLSALVAGVPALLRGPADEPAVWDIPREEASSSG